MSYFISLLISFIRGLFGLLHSIEFTIAGYEVSLFTLLIAFGIIGAATSIFWKGGKA